ncbi:sugar phosphate nucleotidyltransferase [uncultured Brachyspira sp.]|uniref:sugar phosphate nucleotidyltransferase n=1 Tax=uncultured Brachyspira sp. TaxID=221953 RepID=UPI0026387368|nr:sugar phosphate nucleotidyltransferase [uncultured Brachyspira sp.]
MKAIILAAGKGTRLAPMTLIKPKPLLNVHGKTLLENMVHFLKESNINDITIVAGYKEKAFDEYVSRFGLNKVINKNYYATNSSYSLKLVVDNIDDDIIIMNGDLYIKSDFIRFIKKDISQFIGQRLDNTIHDTWKYNIDNNNKLISIDENGKSGLCETGIAYFSKKDLNVLKEELLKTDDNKYWEYCVLNSLSKLDFYVTEVKDIIYEIDSFSDAITHNLLTSDDIADQCSDDNKALRLAGLTNYNYKIRFLGEDKVIRIPGIGTESFVDRPAEKKVTSIVPSTICPKTVFFDWDVKITDYLEGYHSITDEDLNTNFFKLFVIRLKELHNIKLEDYKDFKPMSMHSEINKYESIANKKIVTDTQRDFVLSIADEIENDEQVLCHRDLLYGNIMYNGEDVKLIDFEYSGFSSKYWDLANFICESNMNDEQRSDFISLYDGADEKRVRKAQILVNYIWGYWYIVNNAKYYSKVHINALINNLDILNIK